MEDPRDSGQERLPIRRPLPHILGCRKPWRIIRRTVVCVTCDALAVVVVHYDGRRKTGCKITRGEEKCEGCEGKHPFELQNWVRASDELQRWRPSLLMLTEGALRMTPRLREEGYPLAGLYLAVWRKADDVRSPMGCEILRRPRAGFLPPDEPILPELCRMWDAPDRVYPSGPLRVVRSHPDDDVPGSGPPEKDRPMPPDGPQLGDDQGRA